MKSILKCLMVARMREGEVLTVLVHLFVERFKNALDPSLAY